MCSWRNSSYLTFQPCMPCVFIQSVNVLCRLSMTGFTRCTISHYFNAFNTQTHFEKIAINVWICACLCLSYNRFHQTPFFKLLNIILHYTMWSASPMQCGVAIHMYIVSFCRSCGTLLCGADNGMPQLQQMLLEFFYYK